MQPFLPFALLVLSLALFLVSTRQLPILWRSGVWGAALVALVFAASIAAAGWNTSISLHAISDVVFGQHGGDVLATAFTGNFGSVAGALAPMFGIFLLPAALIAFTTLVAFTPGERIEKAIRPVNLLLIGAVGGAAFAISAAGLGLGGLEKRQVFVGFVDPGPSYEERRDIIDGDTIRMGDVSLRLWGVDAPETGQLCLDENKDAYDCGMLAWDALQKLVRDNLLVCKKPDGQSGDLSETFGRPLVTCSIFRDRKRTIDVAQHLSEIGVVDVYRDNKSGKPTQKYKDIVGTAKNDQLGIYRGCPDGYLEPGLWRNDLSAKCRFLQQANSSAIVLHARASCSSLPTAANDNAPTLK